MTLPDLDELIREVDGICPSTDWIDRLKVAVGIAARLQSLGDELVTEYVEHARFRSRSWAEVGEALGVSRQAAQQRFTAPHVEYPSDEFTDELQRAMPLIKQAAIEHRHNYIGTEHVLIGVTAETNAASRLIASHRASVAELRADVLGRMSVGASQAAERIAWTPYARKTMILASAAAAKQQQPKIGCDHIIIGLVRLGRGMAAQALNAAGITATEFSDD